MTDEDPKVILSKRFARGEISSDEYQTAVSLLSKSNSASPLPSSSKPARAANSARSSERVLCKNCGASILPSTSEANLGVCGVCNKRSKKSITLEIGSFLQDFFGGGMIGGIAALIIVFSVTFVLLVSVLSAMGVPNLITAILSVFAGWTAVRLFFQKSL